VLHADCAAGAGRCPTFGCRTPFDFERARLSAGAIGPRLAALRERLACAEVQSGLATLLLVLAWVGALVLAAQGKLRPLGG